MNLLEIKNLSFSYSSFDANTCLPVPGKEVLHDISLCIPEGSFVTLCGDTGSGKSTLLKLIKNSVAPKGTTFGDILFCGKNIKSIPEKELASDIGFIFQNPEDQLVTDKVWHEIVFAMENLGFNQTEAETRLAEVLAFLRLESISRCDTASLSGGQKQLVSLASVLSVYPKLLLLDEPTSQLDPEAAELFISVLKRLHSELGLTIIIAEHRLEHLLPVSDMLIILEDGKIAGCDSVQNTLLQPGAIDLLEDLPLSVRLGAKLSGLSDYSTLPLDIDSSRRLLHELKAQKDIKVDYETVENSHADTAPCLILKDISYRYPGASCDIICDMSASFMPGKIYSLLGCNASGKSTLLKLLAGLIKPTLGKLKLSKEIRKSSAVGARLCYLPQDVEAVFVCETAKKDLAAAGLSEDTYPDYIKGLDLSLSPLDFSGGEKQLLGIAKVTANLSESSACALVLLDEPTKGTDKRLRTEIVKLLKALKSKGATIIMASHDMEFVSECADECAIMSMGRSTVFKPAREFFTANRLFTTPARAISRDIIDNIYLEKEILSLHV